jgi:hypothetical protein
MKRLNTSLIQDLCMKKIENGQSNYDHALEHMKTVRNKCERTDCDTYTPNRDNIGLTLATKCALTSDDLCKKENNINNKEDGDPR